jgi:hypothetical protein
LRSFHGDNVGIPVEGYRNRGWMDGWMNAVHCQYPQTRRKCGILWERPIGRPQPTRVFFRTMRSRSLIFSVISAGCVTSQSSLRKFGTLEQLKRTYVSAVRPFHVLCEGDAIIVFNYPVFVVSQHQRHRFVPFTKRHEGTNFS